MTNQISRVFTLKKDECYDGGDDLIMEWIVDKTTKEKPTKWFEYQYDSDYEVKVIITRKC